MESVIERFLRYIKIDTESARKSDTFPQHPQAAQSRKAAGSGNCKGWDCPTPPWTSTAM